MSNNLKKYSLIKRKSLVNVEMFSEIPLNTGEIFKLFPDILKGSLLKEFINLWKNIKRNNKKVAFAFGGHVIKCGLSKIICELIKKRYIHYLVLNGASAIHDIEIAMAGKTSEDVDEALQSGSFGMAEETGSFFCEAAIEAKNNSLGLGEVLKEKFKKSNFLYKEYSVFYCAAIHNIPITIHTALGVDIVHMHDSFNAEAFGAALGLDFEILVNSIMPSLCNGLFINFGSSVIIPEVFLKALSKSRNLYNKPQNFYTANFDMIKHYRPITNLVKRPHIGFEGKGFDFTGHHEIMIPLIYMMLTLY